MTKPNEKNASTHINKSIQYYPLTHPQKAIWNIEKVFPDTSIGNVAATIRFKENIDFELFEKAVNIYIEQNDAMRLRVIEKEGMPYQYISEYKYYKLDIFDFTQKTIEELYEWDEKVTQIPLALIDNDLFYFAFIKISEQECGVYSKLHHWISDAWTMTLMGDQVVEIYIKLKENVEILNEKKPSYIEYVLSEEEYEKSERCQKDKEYWNSKFETITEQKPLKVYDSKMMDTRARRKTLLVPKKLTTKMHEYCKENKSSVFALFIAALSMYINRITENEHINLGTTTLNRANRREKDTVGMFSNISSMQIDLDDNMDFKTLTGNVAKESLSLLRHQKYPYYLVLKDLRERHKIAHDLFDIVLNYQNSKLNKDINSETYTTRWHFNGHQSNNLIIHINDREDEGHLIIDYDYLTYLFHAKEIEFMHQHIINLLWHALDDSSKNISKLEMLSEKEKHKILYEFDNKKIIYPENKVIGVLSEEIGAGKRYILDKNLNLMPIGITGELYVPISEDSLTTAKEVIENPFEPGKKLYKTEHMARWFPEGDIEYKHRKEKKKQAKETPVKVVSTFTAEPIQDYIQWWGKKFGHNLKVEFAGYNQVFQELLDPNSILSKNKDGINIILIRFEDFIRNDNGTEETKIAKLEQAFEELKEAINEFANPAPLIAAIFPVSTHLGLSNAIWSKIEELNSSFEEMLLERSNIYTLDLAETQKLYSIRDVFDGIKDKEAHMPFTEVYYAASGTQIARKICAIKKQHFKVIVLDCDNTLWKGVCGEQGALGVKVKGAYKELQEFMLQKYNEGMLLAICTKNNQKDVLRVFDKNPEMVLNRNHIVNWKISWQEKSQNIKEIANELNLGLDSFIYIDDNPIECSKMVEKCPEVLTLQLPSQEELIPIFLKHVWAFDKVNVTTEDMLRSSMYQAEQKRKEIQESGISLDDYIKNLDFKISMRVIKDEAIERVAQLTQRTNQFNLSTIRRTKKEIKELMQEEKTTCFVIEASDKFGDYGIIGLIVLKEENNKLLIDTFLLSCRILGRKAEYAVLSGIRKYAQEQGKKELEAVFISTAKNKPMQEFIEGIKWTALKTNGKSILYNIAVNDLPERVEHIEFYYNEMYKKNSETIELLKEEEIFALDHLAIAVKDIKGAEEYYKTLGYTISSSVYDSLQSSYLSMCNSSKYLPIELVAPVDQKSPSYNIIEIRGEAPYHLCYRVSSIKRFLEKIKDVEYEIISDAKPAILFGNRKVAFIMIKKVGLIELVETENQPESKNNTSKFKNNTIKIVVNDLERAQAFYKSLGYVQEKNVKDIKNNLIITGLVGVCGEKIELITPLDKETIEYEFLKKNGAGISEIHYRISEKEMQKQFNNTSYNVFYKSEQNKKTTVTEFELCDIEMLNKTKHKDYLLPISNFTGKKLLRLPIYEGINNQITEYQAPTNETEEKLARIWRKVLRTTKIGTNNNFFELGGDSLSAVEIIARVHKEFNIELSLIDIFQANTIKKLAEKIAGLNQSQYEHIKVIDKQHYYELSSAQKRMYILSQIEEEVVYNECYKIQIEGNLDKNRLEKAFKEFIKRHETLRTGFEILHGKPVQKIYDQVEFEILRFKAKEEEIEEIAKGFVKVFDLSNPPLLRVKLIDISEGKYVLLVDIHHIIIDGTSFGILIKEILSLYEGNQLEPLKIQYKDFAYWQNELFESDKIKKQEEYWIKQFNDEIPVLNMPTDYPRPARQSFNGYKKYFTLRKNTVEKLKAICDKTQTTLFMLLLSAYNVLLGRYTGQEDIVVGTPISGRRHADIKDVVGVFINTLPIRTYPNAKNSFTEYLSKVKEAVLMGLENQDFQYEHLIDKLSIPRDLSRNPLFDVMFILQNTDVSQMRTKDLKFAQSKIENNKTKFDMCLSAIDKNEQLEFEIEYCTELFEESTIERLQGHFLNILEDISNQPDKLISDIEILSKEEKNRILYQFNDTYAEYPKDKTIHQLFQEQVERTPDNIALVFEYKQLTYRELNARANQLASLLRSKGIKPDTIVGIMVERSIEMIIGILAILKSGGCYLPIDPEYPQERIEYMLQDSAAKILLTQKDLAGKVQFRGEVIEIDNNNLYQGDDSNLENLNKPNDLIYVIYTSGSTGNPKGVMLEHRNISNFITGITNRISFNDKDVILCITTISFDIFVLETWLPLSKGIKIVLTSESQQIDMGELSKVIAENEVSMIQMTPSRMKLLLEDPRAEKVFDSLRTIMLGGEALPQPLFEALKNKTKARIYNMYGPTETAVWSSVKDLTDETNITLGEPIANTQFYILNKNVKSQPFNIDGELCISGEGLARGYFNRPELTAEKYVQNPFIDRQKIYKTGDLVRRLPDGSIKFIGRIDDQVKIRGFRIELSEIKSCLMVYQYIKDAVVLASKESDSPNTLYSYYISDSEIDIDKLREYLLKKLPNYMVPSFFVQVDSFPQTPNGKLDKKALLSSLNVPKVGYDDNPSNDTEEIILNCWKRQLRNNNIGVNDSFFTVGGDSLSIITIISELLNHKWDLKMQDFYDYPTVREIANKIIGANTQEKELHATDFPIIKNKGVQIILDKNILCENVLLTGATGFVGIHILLELIKQTNVNIYCLLRGEYNKSKSRLADLLHFYFGHEYDRYIDKRIFCISGDVSLEKLGLSNEEYNKLGEKIDLVIHTAALVKHQGNYSEFERINVFGTQRVVDFAKLFNIKLGYMSTESVSGDLVVKQKYPRPTFTENDLYIGQNYLENVYIRSKFEAESLVIREMQNGLDAVIFRLGFITGRYSDGQFQINMNDNNFYNILKSIIQVGVIPKEIFKENIEFTPVDCCADGIVKLIMKEEMYGNVLHLYNHNYIKAEDLYLMINNMFNLNVKTIQTPRFDEYLKYIKHKSSNNEAADYIANNFNYEKTMINNYYRVNLSSHATQNYIKQVNFKWPQVDEEYIKKTLDYLIHKGFLKTK
ncbi:MAG: amino acid adenylation domain-containing protein [Deltaproteobacteria bacterium]